MVIQTGKEEVKLLLFTDDMRVYISDPTNSIRELLQPINTFSNLSGYKICSKKKTVALLYINKKKLRKKSEEHHHLQ